MLYKNSRFKKIIFSIYATSLKTTISQRSLKNLGLRLLLFEFNNFSYIKTSVSRDQTPTNDSAVSLSRDTDGDTVDTDFYQFLETGTSDRTLMDLD